MKKNALTIYLVIIIISASMEKVYSQNKTEFNADECRTSLWKHVYDPSRLEIIDSCISVTGIIRETKAEDDGDEHLLLTLDAGQDGLLAKKNFKKKGNDLVLELVCANQIKDKKAKKSCKGFKNSITVPPVGAHVKVTGSYVNDSHNGWTEIHPVSKIEVIN
jgi:hypothetical protein